MRLAAARVFVTDLPAARGFYVDGVGLTERAAGPGYLVLDAGGADLVLEVVGDHADDDDRALVGRFTGLSLEVTDARAAYDQLGARGVRFDGEPAVQPWGGVLATVVDPAGNRLQLVQYPGRA